MRKEWSDYSTGIVVKFELTGRDGTIYTEHTMPICETPDYGEYCFFRLPTVQELEDYIGNPNKRVTMIYDHPRLPLKYKYK